MKALLKSLLGGLSGYLVAAAVGAAMAGSGAYWVQGLRLDAANLKAENAAQRERNAQVDLKACRDANQRQNDAIAQAEQRAKAAQEAMTQANQARDQAEYRATQILRERTPANVDRCVAAREAFAAELKKEREP